MSETFRATRSAAWWASARRMPTYSIRPFGRTFVWPARTVATISCAMPSGVSALLDWVQRLPDGLDTHVGEGGRRLSAGERRRISVARALLADFPVIVFDEPTANLDQPTADALVRDILAATADRATVLITHRLSALELVDEIIVLTNGGVAERGSHDQLLLAGGLYTRRVGVRARPTPLTPIIDAVEGTLRHRALSSQRERLRGTPTFDCEPRLGEMGLAWREIRPTQGVPSPAR